MKLFSPKFIKKSSLILGLPTFAILSALSLRAADNLSELRRFQLSKEPSTVSVRQYLADKKEPLGKIVSAFKPASYLSNDDNVYLNFYKTVPSVGDRYIVYNNHGGVDDPEGIFSTIGNRIQIKGFVRITRVEGNTIVGRLYDANARIERGDLIGPPMDLEFRISPKEPNTMVRGRVLGGADDIEMIGAYQLAFINKGTKAGLTLNDRLLIIRTGENPKSLDPNLPEVPMAELIVVDAQSEFSTVYVLSSNEQFEAGAHFKAAKEEARYLDD